MPQGMVAPHGDSASVVLPAVMLKSLGLRDGDVVHATLADRQVILRSTEDAAHRELLEKITNEVFEEREEAYRRLA